MSLFGGIVRTALGGAVQNKTAGRGLLGAGVGLIAARIATRSVPGAALVGGGLLAKYLWDRRQGKKDKMSADSAMTAEDVDMAIARAPDIAEGAVTPARGIS